MIYRHFLVGDHHDFDEAFLGIGSLAPLRLINVRIVVTFSIQGPFRTSPLRAFSFSNVLFFSVCSVYQHGCGRKKVIAMI
jgi:hypothetical protein